ncbi:MAG: glutamate--cysteine ligase [Candidatus Dasytiphilus stammeri]
MIPDVSMILPWLETHADVLINGIKRGLERETLRVQLNGNLANTFHPSMLGCALTHKWITTDFAEAHLEFITPVDNDLHHMLTFLRDIHRHVAHRLDKERMWPLSMPGFINPEEEIMLAQYGSSNLGKMKTLYRQGLKTRYGTMMQMISGVHYNFSLPLKFWQAWANREKTELSKEVISSGYLRLIRNYYRFGWILPYLFGSSPAICSSFIPKKNLSIPLKYHDHDMLYLPFATSLRLSDLGYTSKTQDLLKINLNSLKNYVSFLKYATKTPYEEYVRIGLKKNGSYLQLNTNILQIENELYAPIRPKRVTYEGESLSDALLRGGIEYVEVRSLDINPFSPIGINLEQLRFLDLFLIWCLLADAVEINKNELIGIRKNWDQVILDGRRPGKKIHIYGNIINIPLANVGKALFRDLRFMADIMDSKNGNDYYQDTCNKLVALFDYPKLTYSAKILKLMMEQGIQKTGMILSEQYHQILINEAFEIITPYKFAKEVTSSCLKQAQIEAQDTISFANFLAKK